MESTSTNKIDTVKAVNVLNKYRTGSDHRKFPFIYDEPSQIAMTRGQESIPNCAVEVGSRTQSKQ